MFRGQELPTAYVHTKFEGRSFIRLRNIGTFRCAALIDSVTLTFDLLTLKSVWESHATWGTPVISFVFLGLLVFELEPMYATSDRQTDDGRRSSLNAPPTGWGHNKYLSVYISIYHRANFHADRCHHRRDILTVQKNLPQT